MATDETTKYLRSQLVSYLNTYKGIDIKKPFKCLNPAHDDKNPSMQYYEKKDIVKCFACSATYDLFDIIGIDYNIREFNDQKKQAEDLFPTGIIKTKDKGQPMKQSQIKQPEPVKETQEASKRYIEECHKNVSKTDYYAKRGISQATIDKYKLGYDPEKQQAILPAKETYCIRRSTIESKARYFNQAGSETQLFNLQELEQKEPVFVTEGMFDALSILQAGYHAIAINSASNTRKLIMKLEPLTEAPELIIYPDNDEPGEKAAQTLYEAIKAQGKAVRIAKTPKEYKDANDFLMKAESRFKAAIKAEYEGEDTTSISYHLKELTGKDIGFFIPTGFNDLDKQLDGGFYEGLIILGAIPSLGKTTFALQMAMQMAEAGHQVYFYSLEQSARELTLKLISNKTGFTVAACRDIASEKQQDTGVIDYNREKDNLMKLTGLHFIEDKRNATDIDRDIQTRYYKTGKPAMIIIDYLQILERPAPGVSDKQAVDINVTALKVISKTYKVPVLAISNLNRDSYNHDITMTAFKESGGIEYSSDILIGMQWQSMEKKAKDEVINHEAEKAAATREIQIKILKNRNGSAGGRIDLDYKASINRIWKYEQPDC